MGKAKQLYDCARNDLARAGFAPGYPWLTTQPRELHAGERPPVDAAASEIEDQLRVIVASGILDPDLRRAK
jgi:hypothetical protein